jgi:mono/diheme cytochrome c family protein
MLVALASAVIIVAGLYAWDSAARTAEAALRPVPVAPLAVPLRTPTPPVPAAPPIASAVAASGALAAGDPGAGQRVFVAQCTSCHPGANAGIGPALYGPQFVERYPDDAPLLAVIRQGKGGMPAFLASQLDDADLANVVAYMRGLASGAVAPAPTPTPRPRRSGG